MHEGRARIGKLRKIRDGEEFVIGSVMLDSSILSLAKPLLSIEASGRLSLR